MLFKSRLILVLASKMGKSHDSQLTIFVNCLLTFFKNRTRLLSSDALSYFCKLFKTSKPKNGGRISHKTPIYTSLHV